MKPLRDCAVSTMAIALSCAAMAADSPGVPQARGALLALNIAISWNAPVSALGQLLAERLGIPYKEICPTNARQVVVLQQSDNGSISDALRDVNAQLQPGQAIDLVSTTSGVRIELARTLGISASIPRLATAECDSAALQELDARSRNVAPVHVTGPSAGAPSQAPKYVLRESERVDLQLQRWAEAAGWKLLWYPQVTWEVISSSTYSNDLDVSEAVEAVVKILRGEGKQIVLSIAQANRLMEVNSMDITDRTEGNDE